MKKNWLCGLEVEIVIFRERNCPEQTREENKKPGVFQRERFDFTGSLPERKPGSPRFGRTLSRKKKDSSLHETGGEKKEANFHLFRMRKGGIPQTAISEKDIQ